METTKEQQAAWKRYFGKPIVDEGGDEYIPEAPASYIRGWKDGQFAIMNSCDFRYSRSADNKMRELVNNAKEDDKFKKAFIHLIETINNEETLEYAGFEDVFELANFILDKFKINLQVKLHEAPNDLYLAAKQ